MNTNPSNCSLGIDVGSVTLKLALLDAQDRVVFSSYDKHFSSPLPVLAAALGRLLGETGVETVISAAVTGSGRERIGRMLGLRPANEIVAQVAAVAHFCPEARTVIEIGGQDSKFIRLKPAGRPGDAIVLHQAMNDMCAAGTGAFVEQQAERMKIPLDAFGPLALESREPAFVAGRCAVFSKTDVVHLQQEGVPERDIAAGICRAVARNYVANFSKGRAPEKPVIFQGGLAANPGVVHAFRDLLQLGPGDLAVPPHFKIMVAIGAAILSREHPRPGGIPLRELTAALAADGASREAARAAVGALPPLEPSIRRLDTLPTAPPRPGEEVLVGIDIGSTSTCVAVLNRRRELLGWSYTMNQGNVIESVRAAMSDAHSRLGDAAGSLRVLAAGVTGSGRALIAQYVGADVVKDEITAQARAAAVMMPDADTVFEMGGQDSKYIRVSRGRVVDFEMNKVCAAGTGSFLHEQAARMNEPVSRLAELAFQSRRPPDLGTRCTVFMESDLVNYQQMGFSREDLAAGLSYSVARNYLEKVVAGKPVGNRILFLGGVAFNHGVVAAFRRLLGKDVVVPDRHDVSAAIGMALLAGEEWTAGRLPRSRFRGFLRGDGPCRITSFLCRDCSNSCRINRIVADDSAFCHGGVCGKHEQRKQPRVSLPDPFREREALLRSFLRPPAPGNREKIGIPQGHLYYELFPAWCVFLQELGYEVVLSDPTDTHVVNDGLEKTAIDNCFASKVMYGHVRNLLRKGVRRIFIPSVVEFERRVPDHAHNYCCPHVQSVPRLLESVFPEADIIHPVIVRERRDTDWQDILVRTARAMGHRARDARRAVDRARAAQREFVDKREAIGRRLLSALPPDARALVVMGKVYNVCDPALNLKLADQLLARAVIPIPFDCLPLSEQTLPPNYADMVWASGRDIVRAARLVLEDPRLYPLFVTNFGCGPDSFIVKYLEEIFGEKSFLTVEVDEHTSDVGVATRLDACLNNLHNGHAADFLAASSAFRPFVPSSAWRKSDRLLYLPPAFPAYRAIAAACDSIGLRAKFLPPHDRETERLGRLYNSGKECIPYVMDIGDVIRMTRDPEFDPDRAAFLLPTSTVGCRIALFATSIRLVLRQLGYPQVPILSPRVSMDTDDVRTIFGIDFVRKVFRGMLSIELLSRKLSETRPYERAPGHTDRAFEDAVEDVCGGIRQNAFWTGLDQAVRRFDALDLDTSVRRPIIGLLGDDYTRANRLANNDVVREIESLGGEVWNVGILSTFLAFQRAMKPRKMLQQKRYVELAFDVVKSAVGRADTARIYRAFDGRLKCLPDPDFAEIMESTSRYLDSRTEPLVIMALAHALHLVKHGVHGLVSVVGFQCMIYNIVSACLKEICREHGNLPSVILYCDFQERIHHKNRLEAFIHQVHQYRDRRDLALVADPEPAGAARPAG